MPIVDLSHTIRSEMVTYPGLPAPVIGEHLSFDASHEVYAAGTEFAIGRIEMVGNTGTYLDTPAHRHRTGHDLAGLPLERCALLPLVVVDGAPEGPTEVTAFAQVDEEVLAGCAVVVRTGWDQHFGFDHYGAPEHPYLSTEAARWLADRDVWLVGIDSVNIDQTPGDGSRPVHTLLLDREIPVVEHLTNLASVPHDGATFYAVPPKLDGMATFPVRAFATW
jgi:arylformamidase